MFRSVSKHGHQCRLSFTRRANYHTVVVASKTLQSTTSTINNGKFVLKPTYRQYSLLSAISTTNLFGNNGNSINSSSSNIHSYNQNTSWPMCNKFCGYRVFSSAAAIAANTLIIGSHKFANINPQTYNEIIHNALDNGITTIEAGQESGDDLLQQALQNYFVTKQSLDKNGDSDDNSKKTAPLVVKVLKRIGYRTVAPENLTSSNKATAESANANPTTVSTTASKTDTIIAPLTSSTDTADQTDSVASLQSKPRLQFFSHDVAVEDIADWQYPEKPHTQVLHNIGSEYIKYALNESPTVRLSRSYANLQKRSPDTQKQQQQPRVQVVAVLHNPEMQGLGLTSSSSSDKSDGVTFEERQDRIKKRLAHAFIALEGLVKEGVIAGYGVSSNGLGLPAKHPLHLADETLIAAAKSAKQQLQDQQQQQEQQQQNSEKGESSSSNKSVSLNLQLIELPANLLETTGLQVAKELRHALQTSDAKLSSQLQICAMRPLTCYPDQGAGSGHPFTLADYLLPIDDPTENVKENDSDNSDSTSGNKEKSEPRMAWTHTMDGPPEAYEAALKFATDYFKADDLITAKQKGEDLSTEQRETLDGCRLLQSMLFDLDQDLEKVRSFAAHEQNLYDKIIPLIHDTFEEYDDKTANVLQTFFAAYSLAVRYAIAKNTRELLINGEIIDEENKGKIKVPKYPEIPPDMRLQEYALRFLLQDPAIDKIVVGCSQPDHIQEDLEIVRKYYEEKKSKPSSKASESPKEPPKPSNQNKENITSEEKPKSTTES